MTVHVRFFVVLGTHPLTTQQKLDFDSIRLGIQTLAASATGSSFKFCVEGELHGGQLAVGCHSLVSWSFRIGKHQINNLCPSVDPCCPSCNEANGRLCGHQLAHLPKASAASWRRFARLLSLCKSYRRPDASSSRGYDALSYRRHGTSCIDAHCLSRYR